MDTTYVDEEVNQSVYFKLNLRLFKQPEHAQIEY